MLSLALLIAAHAAAEEALDWSRTLRRGSTHADDGSPGRAAQ